MIRCTPDVKTFRFGVGDQKIDDREAVQKKDVGNIMTARNFSYLEHGHERVSEQTAQTLISKIERVTVTLFSKVDIDFDPLAIADQLRIDA